jgi:hypothetical protein
MKNSTILTLAFFSSLLVGASACSDKADDDVAAGSGGVGTGGGATGGGSTGGSTGSGGAGSSCQSKAFFPAADAGLSAPFFATFDYGDNGGSCITLTNPTPGQLCVEGTAAQVVGGDYTTYWGAGLGFNFADNSAGTDLSAYDGFSYTITTPPAGLRVGLKLPTSDDSFFTDTVVAGANTVLYSDLAQGEWVEAPIVLDPTNIADLQFQVPSNADAPVEFNFCVSALTMDSGMGGMGGMGGTGN